MVLMLPVLQLWGMAMGWGADVPFKPLFEKATSRAAMSLGQLLPGPH